jgi:hypothetical protein
VTGIRRLVSAAAAALPVSLMVFIAAIFLSYGVNAFTTIYAVPGHPAHSFALWCSFVSAMIAAGLWSAKKERIEKATLSGGGDLAAREQRRLQMWDEISLKAALYLGGATAFSILAMVILVFPLPSYPYIPDITPSHGKDLGRSGQGSSIVMACAGQTSTARWISASRSGGGVAFSRTTMPVSSS